MGMAEATHRRLEIALGVDQEVGGNYHLLAVLYALDDFYVGVATRAELDLARLEAAFALLDQDNLARAAIDHSGDWHSDDLGLCADGQFHLSEHAGLEQSTRVGEFQTNRN